MPSILEGWAGGRAARGPGRSLDPAIAGPGGWARPASEWAR